MRRAARSTSATLTAQAAGSQRRAVGRERQRDQRRLAHDHLPARLPIRPEETQPSVGRGDGDLAIGSHDDPVQRRRQRDDPGAPASAGQIRSVAS